MTASVKAFSLLFQDHWYAFQTTMVVSGSMFPLYVVTLNVKYFRFFSAPPEWGHGVAFWEGVLVGRYKKGRLCHWMTLLVVYQWRMTISGSNKTLTFPPTSNEEHFNLLPFGREVGVWGQHGVCVCPTWPIVMKSWYEHYVHTHKLYHIYPNARWL